MTDVQYSKELDLRDMPIWQRAQAVRDVLDRLPPGSALSFITDNDPRGLSATILDGHSADFMLETRRVGRGLWRVGLAPRQSQLPGTAGHLDRCAAFADLSSVVHDELAAAAIPQTLRRGEVLVAENVEWPFVGMVTEGIVAREDGELRRRRVYFQIFPSELFGVTEYFDRGLSMSRIVGFSKGAKVLKLPWSSIRAVAQRHPELTVALGALLAQRIRGLVESAGAAGSSPILGRVARVLLAYARTEQGLVPAVPSLGTITQAQIAASAGTVKEVAARAIAELESRGVLRREHGHIRYLDRARLVDLIRELG